MVWASFPLTKSAVNVSVLAQGDVEATESILDIHPLGPSGSTFLSLSVPDRASSVFPKHVKRSAATGKSPRTWKNLARGGSKIKLTVTLASSSSANLASFSQGRSHSVSPPNGARRSRSSASCILCSGDLNNDCALVLLFDCNESTSEASS